MAVTWQLLLETGWTVGCAFEDFLYLYRWSLRVHQWVYELVVVMVRAAAEYLHGVLETPAGGWDKGMGARRELVQRLVEPYGCTKKTSDKTIAEILRKFGSYCEQRREGVRSVERAEKGARGERGSILFSANNYGHRLLPLPRHLDTRHQGEFYLASACNRYVARSHGLLLCGNCYLFEDARRTGLRRCTAGMSAFLGYAQVDNVLLHWVPGAQRPILKLCDFSFSREQLRSQPCKSACGTPEYMSPQVTLSSSQRMHHWSR